MDFGGGQLDLVYHVHISELTIATQVRRPFCQASFWGRRSAQPSEFSLLSFGPRVASRGSLCGMSPFSRHMSSLPLSQIRLTDPFWSRWQRTMVQQGLLAQYDQLVKTDRLKNFERAAAGEKGGFEGYRFNDSDVYKWLEACAYSFGNGSMEPSSDLKAKVDHAIDVVARAQMPDGYLNTFFQLMHGELRWRNLSMMHEMYCGGHLIEGGVAFFEATGDRRLLDVAIKFADHVDAIFGPGKRRSYCGHEEIELALLKNSPMPLANASTVTWRSGWSRNAASAPAHTSTN